MHIVLVVASETIVPVGLRRIIQASSTSVDEVAVRPQSTRAADHVLVWTGTVLDVRGELFRWPEDESEIRMLLQTGV